MSCQIYCIEDCNQLKYVGSTTTSLKQRLYGHKYEKKKDKCCSSKKLDLDNCKIYQLEECDDCDRRIKEQYWIDRVDCVNIMGTTPQDFKKYYQENKDKIKERSKQYNLKNKHKKKEYMKKYCEYKNSWGGNTGSNNNLLKIDVNLFLY